MSGVRGVRLCPICKEQESLRHRPFCSERCAYVDLHRWLSNGYAIAGDEGRIGEREEEDNIADA